MAVTLSRKCYVFQCLACESLFDAYRSDVLTCSPACRVQQHRHPERLVALRAVAARRDVSVRRMREAGVIRMLRPDLVDAIAAGTRTIDDVQPEIQRAYWQRVMACMRDDAPP